MPTDLLPIAITVVFVGGALCVFIIRAWASAEGIEDDRKQLKPFRFTAHDLGGFSYSKLILISLFGLFLELALIRWISCEIRIFAYLKNFVLIACFLGFGLGFYMCRRVVLLLTHALPLLLLTLIIEVPWPPIRRLVEALPVLLGATSEVQIWGVGEAGLSAYGIAGLVAAAVVVLPLFIMISALFVPIGQLTGWFLENASNGIRGYTTNVLASLFGIGMYTAIAFLDQPPSAWFGVAALLLLSVVWSRVSLRGLTVFVYGACVALLLLPEDNAYVRWSPYQKLSLTATTQKGEIVEYQLRTNNSWFQKIIDLSPGFVARHPDMFAGEQIEFNGYDLPYRIMPRPQSVLILGSGMGNDVAAALRNDSGQIVAVEIDPLIIELGTELHLEQPYSSVKVETVIDDARSYLQHSKRKFDLIVFSLLDSHTTASNFSNIRIDNYVYTQEALTRAAKLLNPDGVFIIKFQVQRPWIAGRLKSLLSIVFGEAPLQIQLSGRVTTGTFFVSGSEHTISKSLENRNFNDFVSTHSNVKVESTNITTDDWPFFYQRRPGIPLNIGVISALLVLICLVATKASGIGLRQIRLHFLFLGAGFMLLEVQIISRMALLFGSTWIVNSIVIGVILLTIVAANLLVGRWPQFRFSIAATGLIASLVVSYVVPLQAYFFDQFWLRVIIATPILCVPVFFASIIFIRSFARAGFSGNAMGSNLIGALIGGLLESISLLTGLKALLLIAFLLYCLAVFFLRQENRICPS